MESQTASTRCQYMLAASRISFQLNQTLRGKAKKDEDNGDGNGRPDDLEAVIPMDPRRFPHLRP